MNKFLEFLYDPNLTDTKELRRDLEAYGVNVARVENEVAKILAKAESADALGWLDRARVKQAEFDRKAREHGAAFSQRFKHSRELIEAILSGDLGQGVQARASVFFRNKTATQISEQDLKSFIEDCELLDLL